MFKLLFLLWAVRVAGFQCGNGGVLHCPDEGITSTLEITDGKTVTLSDCVYVKEHSL